MRAELARRMSPDALGFVAPRDEVRVSWQRAMSARVNGGLALRAIDAEGSPDIVNSGRRYGRAELDIEWQLRPTWSFVAAYAYATALSEDVAARQRRLRLERRDDRRPLSRPLGAARADGAMSRLA